jgi:hypothetical protein
MTNHERAILDEDRAREMACIAEMPRLVGGGTLARCIVCETVTHDATTCSVCVDRGDPCLYCAGCVRECRECKEQVCYEHFAKGSTRCVECVRRDNKLTGDLA